MFEDKLNAAFSLYEEGRLIESKEAFAKLFTEDISAEDEIDLRLYYGYPLSSLGLVEEAIDNYDKLQELGEELGLPDIICAAIHQQGMVYRENKDYKTALSIFDIEKTYIDANMPEDDLAKSMNNYELGYTNLLLDNLDLAKYYIEESLFLALDSDDLIAIACAYRALGEYYERKSDYASARVNFNFSIHYFDQADDEIGSAEVNEMIIQMDSNNPYFKDKE